MKTYIIYGLRRSGNHFIISTILQQYTSSVHINDSILSHEQYTRYREKPKTHDRSDRRYIGFQGADAVVISMENKSIDFDEISKFQNVDDVHVVCILRNPYNNLASAWKIYVKDHLKPDINKVTMIRDLWPGYCDVYMNASATGNITPVLYDAFTDNPCYRDNFLQTINCLNVEPDTEKSIKWQVSSFGTNQQRACWGELSDNIFAHDDNFNGLFTDEIHEKWSIVKQSYDRSNP